MKHLIVTVVVASATAILAPRDLRDASDLLLKAGAMVIRLGLSLHDWQSSPGYDADYADDAPEQEHAGFRAGVFLSASRRSIDHG